MKRVLTGITSSGFPHLGNILGAIKPGVELSKNKDFESFFFISDLHSMTSIKDAELRIQYRNSIAATWLAFGFDPDSNLFYRQSKVPQVCELAWYLNCFTPFPMLANAHAFKSKSDQLSDVNAGLFTYPVLMAADILLFGANLIPVGVDQRQHVEMTRDIASSFNHKYGEVFTLPEAVISEDLHTIPGTDGRKMSKSYNNYIDIFLPEKQLRKVIMGIETDSTPLEEPKNPDTCNVFAIYKTIANADDIVTMRENYLRGGYGFGHAKSELFELMLSTFKLERERYSDLINNPDEIDLRLKHGEEKATAMADLMLVKVRNVLGF
jgi:tryptophanyl-tRNA synthetase